MNKNGCPEVELVERVCCYLEQTIDAAPTLAEIGAHFHVSPYHLQRTFKRVVGITPRQYAEGYRLENLKSRLRSGSSVTNALYDVGYGSSSRLYERAPEMLGMTPRTYSRGGEGMEIAYSTFATQLGRLLVGKTERGVCAVHIRQTDDELRAQIKREYPLAQIVEQEGALCAWVRAILNHIDGTQPHLDLPLDIQATAFQLNVWLALRTIPYGETRTYGEIAETIGHPNAARAVAEAVHANPVVMVIPCHRVERKDGEPSRYYSTGAEEQRRVLLENEQQNLNHRRQSE